MGQHSFEVGASTVTIVFGDITTSTCEILVSSDDHGLTMGGGVSRALLRAGGSQIRTDAAKCVPGQVADVIVTSAGSLPAKYILHAITIGAERWGARDAGMIVRSAMRKVLELAPLLSCSSIAFPAIGAGTAGLPRKEVASFMVETLFSVLLADPRTFRVELYLLPTATTSDEDYLSHFLEAFAGPPPAQATTPRVVQVQHLLQRLDQRRAVLEEELLDSLSAARHGSAGTEQVQQRLSQLMALRAMYEAELSTHSPQQGRARHHTVFVSSTSRDLTGHREAVRRVIERLDRIFVGMEDFTPEGTAPAEMIRRRVAESELYLGILGMRYGYVDPSSGLSMTELEYQQALATGKELFIFVMDEDAPIKASMAEHNPESLSKLNDFRSRVLRDHTCALFVDEQDLASQVERSLDPRSSA